MQSSKPFARASAMMLAISAAMALSGTAQQLAMSNIGPYESRGHGRGGNPFGRKGGHMAAVRASRKARNVRRNRAAQR